MAIKSLTITEEAYNVLKARKHGDESFSEVIVRIGRNKVGAAAKFFGVLKGMDAEGFEDRIKRRRADIEKEVAQRRKRFVL